jgi:hypothetical protein
MSDTKLDYPSTNRPAGPRWSPAFSPDTKLDLPGTLQDFAQLDSVPVNTPALRAFRDKVSAEAVSDGVNPTIVTIGAPSMGWHWLIERLVVIGGGSVVAYVGGLTAAHAVDLTASGSADVADENSPILANGGELVQLVFTGAALDVLCTANMQAIFVPE